LDSIEFSQGRKKLKKTQKEMAHLLGTSVKAVRSYEQGWRSFPAHVERQLLLLLFMAKGNDKRLKSCWVVKNCPLERRNQCPAWEFRSGRLCWFINGTICEGTVQSNWHEKMKICRSCEVLDTCLGNLNEAQ
jgi:DNA-binding XRE family transcriptional regulator